MNSTPHYLALVALSISALTGCPIEPLPSTSYCGELCIGAANQGRDQGFVEGDGGVIIRPDASSDQGDGSRVTCQVGLGDEGLELVSASGDVQVSKSGRTLSVTGPVGARFELMLVGSSTQHVSGWSHTLTLDASCSEFTEDGLDLYAWGAGGVALTGGPMNLSSLPDVRTAMHRQRGVMAVFMSPLGRWHLVRASGIEASGVQVLALDTSKPGIDASILLDDSFDVEISPSGEAAMFHSGNRVVLVDGLDAQPHVEATLQIGQPLESIRWQGDGAVLARDGFALYRLEPETGESRLIGGVNSEIIDYDIYDAGLIARLTKGQLGRFDANGGRVSLEGGSNDVLELYVSARGEALLFVEEHTCKRDPFEGRCVVSLVDAQTLEPLVDGDAQQVTLDQILAVTKRHDGFLLLGEESGGLRLTRLTLVSGQPVQVERVDAPALFSASELDVAHSLVLEQGFILRGARGLFVIDAARAEARQIEGAWRLWHESKASGSAEYIRDGVMWEESERVILGTRIGEELLGAQRGVHLGEDFEFMVSKRSEQLEELLVGPSDGSLTVIAQTPSIDVLPTPSGAPCVLYIHDVLSKGRQLSDLSMVSCATYKAP